MDKSKLKQIRWFSNGVWQFQPHLYFLSNLVEKEEFEPLIQRMDKKEIVNVEGHYFKLEETSNE